MKLAFRIVVAALFTLAPHSSNAQQAFSCPWGKDAACLDYGDTVCSMSGRCVAENAVCFDSYQCDFNGFACKSDVDECIASHDRLAEDYNELLADAQLLARELEQTSQDLDQLRDCITLALTLESARLCY